MGRVRLSVWVLAALLMVTTAACGQPAMTRTDARAFARNALTHIGFTGVQVDSQVTLASYRSPDTRFRNQPVQVWRTHSTVPEGTIDLYVTRKGNTAVFVRDEATAGGPLLTERQFRLLRDFRLNPAADRRRNHLRVPTILAVILALVVACALFFASVTGAVGRSQPEGDEKARAAPVGVT